MVEIWMDRGSMEHQIRIGHVNKLEQRSNAYQEIRCKSKDFFLGLTGKASMNSC